MARATRPLADSLKRRPPISRCWPDQRRHLPARDGGQIIDGREGVRVMAAATCRWGDAFGRSADAGPQAVQDRIEALVEYSRR
jgi:hypothetical protein